MEAFRLERHLKLWEDNNTRIQRVVFLSLVLSVALVVKVLTPFVENSRAKEPALEKIESLEGEKSAVSEKLLAIEHMEAVLKRVTHTIDEQPWQQQKRDLIESYRQMRTGFDREDYQDKADATIEDIANTLREEVMLPLRQGAGAVDLQGRNLQQLDAEIVSLDGFIDGWQAEYTGARWYDTIRDKDRAMVDLSDSINERLDLLSGSITKAMADVELARSRVDDELTDLNGQITDESDRLAEIEKELAAILPQWLEGLVKIHQVIQLLPLLLLGAALYVLGTGVSLTRHYQRYAAGNQFGADLIAEPAMSSTWTLIPRGRFGTVLTCLAYSLFFLVCWWLLEESIDLLQDWLAIDASAAWITQAQVWDGFRWLSRILFVSLLVYVWSMPVRAGNRGRGDKGQ